VHLLRAFAAVWLVVGVALACLLPISAWVLEGRIDPVGVLTAVAVVTLLAATLLLLRRGKSIAAVACAGGAALVLYSSAYAYQLPRLQTVWMSPRIADAVARRFIGDSLENIAGNIPLLRELGRRYRLGVVSNFYGNLARVCDDAGIQSFFQVFVDSTDIGCLKPDPRIFQRALEALDVPASAATFVGDSLPRDMAGARGVGMRHIWLAGAEPSADGPCCRGDVQIKSLRELEAILL